MTVTYKGFKISASRGKTLGGWVNVSYLVTRISDGYFLIDDFTESTDTVRRIIAGLKERIDEAIKTSGESEGISPDKWSQDAEM